MVTKTEEEELLLERLRRDAEEEYPGSADGPQPFHIPHALIDVAGIVEVIVPDGYPIVCHDGRKILIFARCPGKPS